MLSVFPTSIANKVISAYLIALVISSAVFYKYAMDFTFILFGILEVFLFFSGASYLTKRWSRLSDKTFEKRLFCCAFALRFIWIVYSYIFFITQTYVPFEFDAADSIGYHESADWLSKKDWGFVFNYLFVRSTGVSDSGYVLYLSCLYRLFGVNIFLPRLIKCLLSTYSCLLMRRIAVRHFDEAAGRMTGIFCMLMPNLIWYCGMHLKETEMLFLVTFCIEQADSAICKSGKHKLRGFIVAGMSAFLLFGFRTALGIVAFISIGFSIIFGSSKFLASWQKWTFGTLLAIGLFFSIGHQISSEISEVWERRNVSQETSILWRSTRNNGNAFAVYAGKTIFAPLIFTIPFPTVVDTNQSNQEMINGGNYVKNITSFFTIFAMLLLLLSGEWRKHVLPIAFICGYLLVVAFSAFAQSERFHLPALPFALMFAAYGITHMNKIGYRLFRFWTYFIFAAIIGWSWFKLAGRGLI